MCAVISIKYGPIIETFNTQQDGGKTRDRRMRKKCRVILCMVLHDIFSSFCRPESAVLLHEVSVYSILSHNALHALNEVGFSTRNPPRLNSLAFFYCNYACFTSIGNSMTCSGIWQ